MSIISLYHMQISRTIHLSFDITRSPVSERYEWPYKRMDYPQKRSRTLEVFFLFRFCQQSSFYREIQDEWDNHWPKCTRTNYHLTRFIILGKIKVKPISNLSVLCVRWVELFIYSFQAGIVCVALKCYRRWQEQYTPSFSLICVFLNLY